MIDLNTSNCTARNDVQKHNTHHPVKHLDPVVSQRTTRLKSYAIYIYIYINKRIEAAQQVFGNLKIHVDAACCTFASPPTSTVGKLRIATSASP